jgi:hypothetical protein
MWIALKIGMLYGAPVAALVAALGWLAVTLLRYRRGTIDRGRAMRRYAWTFVLPFAAAFAIWATAEAASFFLFTGKEFKWDADSSLALLGVLVPVAGYLLGAVLVLNLALWATVAWWRPRAKG